MIRKAKQFGTVPVVPGAAICPAFRRWPLRPETRFESEKGTNLRN